MNFLKLLSKAVANPFKAIKYVFKKLSFESFVTDNGERLLLKDWDKAKESNQFILLTHMQRYEWAVKYIKDKIVLDLGCGTGYGTNFLSKNGASKITGIDISKKAVNYARKKYCSDNLFFKHENATKISLPDKTFDAVISFDVIEHISEDNQKNFMKEVCRLLKDDGIALIGCPNSKVSSGNNPYHLKELNSTEMKKLFSGFFDNVKLFGQDILFNKKITGKDWQKYKNTISNYSDLIIIDKDFENSYGLLSLCKEKRK